MKLLLWHLSEAARKMSQVCGLEQIQENITKCWDVGHRHAESLGLPCRSVNTPTHAPSQWEEPDCGASLSSI